MEIWKSKTIAEAFLARCKKEPGKEAFAHKVNGKWQGLTFADQYKTIQRLSIGLMNMGVAKGDKISILAQTSLAWGQFDMAIMGCGAITVPIYPTCTPEDMAYILNHSEVGIVFIDDYKNLMKIESVADQCKFLKKVVVNFDADSRKYPFELVTWSSLADAGLNKSALASRFEQNLRDTKESDTFTICYTSGTTGLPKGAVLSHACMSSAMEDVYKVMSPAGVTEDEELLSFLPMSHIFGKWESMTPYYLGWKQSYAESIDTLLANLAETKPTLWISVPRVYEKAYAKIMGGVDSMPPARQKLFKWALKAGKEHFNNAQKGGFNILNEVEYRLASKLVFSKVRARFGGRLKLAVSGSAPLAQEISEFMHICGIKVYEGYGLTETCAPVSVNMPYANKFGTVGKLLPEVLAKIADDGEILLKSKKVFSGYYKNEEATKETFKDGWFLTGDIGHIDSDGFLKITDRKKDLIKTAGGKFVPPQKIENIAKSSNIISQVVVYGDQKPFITALLTLNQEAVIQYAQKKKILFSEFSELIKNTDISRMVAREVDDVNQKLARWETIKRYHVLPKEFTVEEGDLTPSLKIKRKHLSNKYKDVLEGLYRD